MGGLYGYGGGSFLDAGGAVIICLVLALVFGITLFCIFLTRKNAGRFTGFVEWLYEALNFRRLLIDVLLRVTYLIIAIFLVLLSFVLLFQGAHFLDFLYTLIGANIILRILYELILMTVTICRNTSDINAKLGGGSPNAPMQNSYAPYSQPQQYQQQPFHTPTQSPQAPYGQAQQTPQYQPQYNQPQQQPQYSQPQPSYPQPPQQPQPPQYGQNIQRDSEPPRE